MAYKKLFFSFLAVTSFLLFTKPLPAIAERTCAEIQIPSQLNIEIATDRINELKEIKNKINDAELETLKKNNLLQYCDKKIKTLQIRLIALQPTVQNQRQGLATLSLTSEKGNTNTQKNSSVQTTVSTTEDEGPCSDLPDAENLSKWDLDRHIKEAKTEKRRLGDSSYTVETIQNGTKITRTRRDENIARKEEACNLKIEEYIEAKLNLEQCTEVVKEMEESQTLFRESCGAFSSGTRKCFQAIEACDKCPDAENYGKYNCVVIHQKPQKTKCPALSGTALGEAKEKRKDLEEDIDILKDGIEEKEKDLLSKEEELNDALAEIENGFTSITRDLETQTEEAKNALEEGLKKGKGLLEENIAKQVASVQKQIDSALKIAHSFENAIYKANREYRKERRQITMECESQAKTDLARYRKRRRAAIETGSLSFSLSNFLRRGRMSFAKQDYMLFQQYKKRCLTRRKADFKDVLEEYQQKLRIIDQQKEQYLEIVNKQKKQLALLNQQAHKAGNQLLQEYTTEMGKILARHNKLYADAVQNYNKKKKLIASQTKSLSLLKGQLQENFHTLRGKKNTMLREEEIINYLKSKNSPTSEREAEDAKKEFAEAYTHLEELKGQIEIAKGESGCNCSETRNPNTANCNKIRSAEKTVGSDDDNLDIDSPSGSSVDSIGGNGSK